MRKEDPVVQNEHDESTTTLLIGLGRGGSALLPYIVANEQFKLVGACDSSPEAVGVPMARMTGIPFYEDAIEAIKELKPHLVIDASGDPSLPSALHEVRPAGTSVVTAEASKLLWDLLSALEGRRRSDLRYDRLLSDMNSGIVVVQNAKIRFVNPAFLKMFGYTAENLLGRPYGNIITPEYRDRDMGYHRERVAGHRVVEEYETQVMHGDGDFREVMVRARLSEWDGSAASLVIMSDVTSLRELQRERERFFRFMIHELRAPLSPLVTMMPLLRKREIVEDEEKFGQIAARIQRSVDRLRSFIDDFLDLSKFDQESISVKQTDVDLDSLIREVADAQKILADDKGLELTVEDWTSFPVRGDEVIVRTVVQNLINNAIKYTNEGFVKVQVDRKDDMFSISVFDSGSGLTEEEQNSLFQEYGRIQRTAGVKGTGLGLALVRKLVDACGGDVTVKSEGKDKGSTFTVSLPLVFGSK